MTKAMKHMVMEMAITTDFLIWCCKLMPKFQEPGDNKLKKKTNKKPKLAKNLS